MCWLLMHSPTLAEDSGPYHCGTLFGPVAIGFVGCWLGVWVRVKVCVSVGHACELDGWHLPHHVRE
jgi:hypothetical protein